MRVNDLVEQARQEATHYAGIVEVEPVAKDASMADQLETFHTNFPDDSVVRIQGATDSQLDDGGNLLTCGEAISVGGVVFVHGIDFKYDRQPSTALRWVLLNNVTIDGPVTERVTEKTRWWQADRHSIARVDNVDYSMRTEDTMDLFGEFYHPSFPLFEGNAAPSTGESSLMGLERPQPHTPNQAEYRRLTEAVARHPFCRDGNKASWWHILYTPDEENSHTPLFRPVSEQIPTTEITIQAFTTIFTYFKNAKLENVIESLLSKEALMSAANDKIEQKFLAATTPQPEPDRSQSGYSFGVGTAGGSSAPSL